MKTQTWLCFILLALSASAARAIETPTGFVSRTGDLSIVLHWNRNTETNLGGYRVYRAFSSEGPFLRATFSTLTTPGFCDFTVTNGLTNFYRVTAISNTGQESAPSTTLAAVPRPFANDDEFLDYVQQTAFDYFWYAANPLNGMVPDRSSPSSPCSIAAVGFGLTGIGIGIDHGWISRPEGAQRVLTTLNTFAQGPQGPANGGTIGYKGWFYHFLDMKTGLRYTPFNTELSSIDTTLFLAGVLYAKQYFDGNNSEEAAIRTLADTLYSRVDWNWMARGTNAVCMGWLPVGGFSSFINWIGYNEAMILYCLGLGAPTNSLPDTAWERWTSGYKWATNYNQAYVPFGPLFGHQYSHCWIDFRHQADSFMRQRQITYFENSRRATLAQRAYCIATPRWGYSGTIWGLTASDGPEGYAARGAPPAENDNGTIAPTAAGGSMPFTPEYSLPTLRYFYNEFRTKIWTSYGFRDAFNIRSNYWGPDVLGIDQGPILIMIENYRNQRPWKLFMRNPEVQRGLQRAGFAPVSFMAPSLETRPAQNAVTVAWNATPGRSYQVEYSPDLEAWFHSRTGPVGATAAIANWTDTGPPHTTAPPFDVPQRFYRVFEFPAP